MRNGTSWIGTGALVLMTAVAGLSGGAFAGTSQEQVLYRFAGGNDGAQPNAGLIADAAGNLYGTTSAGGGAGCGGSGCGTVFELSPGQGGGWSETVLWRFKGNTDGEYPDVPLIADGAGNLYGTTLEGGSDNCGAGSGCGTVFELSPGKQGWKENILYAFTTKAHAQRGAAPSQVTTPDVWAPNGIVFGSDGNIYGLGALGGRCVQNGFLVACYGGGFVLEKPANQGGAWKEQVIYRVKNTQEGGPEGPPIFGADGHLYAVTTGAGYGSVFALAPRAGKKEWKEKTLYTFQGTSDGGYPAPGLILDASGNLYGATAGYQTLAGNVFELSAAKKGQWSEAPLYSFSNASGGATPAAAPVNANGTLYGVAEAGGQNNLGVAYALSPQNGGWSETVLYSFAGGSDGATPQGTLLSAGGNLYGITFAGGNGGCVNSQGCGTVFEVTP